ncbi:Membrane sensor protein UhpC [Cupriavidus yeoncheonensis]|uniref:Membrane sensor protein UhpC n=1 Tax=Cupriavidus yeoncheonensis TaxID=1462994 RepID=A0A916IX44_9BURK|nr:MFS transporter [Cupriavidus yeoncheonensis]CAG2150699.1 Membrane sensor protein UhpC [Cupriavidus yeoncheonensis]
MNSETTTRLSVPMHGTDSRIRWLVLTVAWAALVLSTVCRLAWGTLAIPLGQSLSLPLAALGMFVTAFYVGYVLSNFVCGFATDRVGGRVALSASLVSLAVATYAFSYTPSLTVGLVLQALMGLTAGADYAAGVKLVTTWFEKRERGRAVGLLMSASSVAVIATNAILPTLVEAYGWRLSYRLLGVLAVFLAVVCATVLRDRAQAADVSRPGERSLHRARPHGEILADIRALMTRNFVLLALAGCGAFWGTLGFTAWAIPLMVKAHHVAPVQAGYVLAVAGIAGLFAKPAIGWLSDSVGARRKLLAILSLIFFCAALLAFGRLDDLAAFRLAAPFIGVGAFVYSPLLVTMVAEQAGLSKAGSAAGVANAVWQLGSALSPALVGLVFQAQHSFPLAFAVLAAGPLVGAICLAFIKEGQRQ